MGEVFLGEDTKQHGRKVAIKVLPAGLAGDEGRLHRFKQEARAILALNHPNILTIFEVGDSGLTLYIATEFIEGETLRQCLWREPLKLDEALGIAIQVAMALEAAHAAGIVHRDVKPENIMLRHDGFARDRFVKVLDFGLAKLTERDAPASDPEAVTMQIPQTTPGAVIGTSGYMSPEQAQGEEIDSRSDIFSLGILIYEMVAGRPPFSGPTESHVRVSILDHEPAPLSAQSSETPRHLERIVSKALAKDKNKRYQTVADLRLDLEQLREELYLSGSETRSHTLSEATRPTESIASQTRSSTKTQGEAAVTVTHDAPTESLAIRKTTLLILAAVILGVGAAIYFYYSRKPIDSVAVLPFVNDSNDANAEYLSDGITESIIRSLSQLPHLKVMSSSAVFRFKGQQIDPQAIGKSLNVGAVLAGRVVKQGDRLIIKTELIDVSDGSQLWGAEYNNSLSDIFTVQDQISRAISDKLRLELTGADVDKLEKRYTRDADAYELYLKGRYFWNKRTDAGLRSGIRYFQEAEQKDPTYALAYSGLADSYALLSDIGAVKPADEMPKAKAAAQKAVDIDPTLAEAYTSRAFVKLAYDWDWRGAEADFKKALELNSKYATAHQWYASYLMQMGKFAPAKEEIEKAHQLDPLSPIINSNLGLYAYYEHRYDDAIEHCNKTLEMVPDFWVARHYRGLAYSMKGMHAEAIADLRSLLESPGDGPLKDGSVEKDPEVAASLGFAYAAAGRRQEAEAIVERLQKLAQQRYVSPRYVATIYAALERKEQAIGLLNQAFESKHPGLVLIRIDPLFDRLRSEEGFKQLVKRFEPIP